MKTTIETLLRRALATLPEDRVPPAARATAIEVEHTRDPAHGDFASNLALRLAKAARQNPRALAAALVEALPAHPAIAKVEIAGAGFVNFFVRDDAYRAEIARIVAAGHGYGRSRTGEGRRVQVEFV